MFNGFDSDTQILLDLDRFNPEFLGGPSGRVMSNRDNISGDNLQRFGESGKLASKGITAAKAMLLRKKPSLRPCINACHSFQIDVLFERDSIVGS